MSDTFRYLNTAGDDVSGDAASNFLQDKLKKQAKGRYTAQQMEELGQSGGFAVVNSSNGAATDGAPAYDAENPTKNQGVGGAAGNSTGGSGDYSHMTGDSDTERNYREGNWGKGALDAKALAEKYGLDRSQEGEGDDHIWGTNPDGSKVYIGKQTEGLASNEELIKSHSGQANSEEDDHSSAGEELSSKGDVRGAILSQWKSAGGGKEEEGGKEKPNDPIEHSPEIKQAIDRVRTYENDVMSGKLSEDIFGEMKTPGSEYAFDANKGMAGIGTESGVQADDTSARATDSFLDNKKTEVKKEFNFKPSKYGAN